MLSKRLITSPPPEVPASMTADERIALIEVKIERAKKHFVELNETCLAFQQTNPYEVDVKRDPETRNLIYYVFRVDPVPDSLGAIAGDFIQNLRSALDHLIRHLMEVRGITRFDTESNFPIGSDAKDYSKTKLRGMEKILRKDAVDALRSIEAYKGGRGHQLWVLHRLNNIDKHRLLITVSSSFQSVNVWTAMQRDWNLAHGSEFRLPDLKLFLRPEDICCPLRVGHELVVDRPDAEGNEDYQFAFNIALDEAGVIEGKPLLETLGHMGELVSNTITIFKPCLA